MDLKTSVPLLMLSVGLVNAQDEQSACYGSGSIAASVILTLLFTLLLVAGVYFWYRRYRTTKKDHLILETDPEKGGKGDFAFDNPGFKDTSIIAVDKGSNKLEGSKPKWNQWSPLSALSTKSEKKRTLDDSAIEPGEVKTIALRSQDFTGLGFTVCGSMRDGIFVRDVLHHGPAYESGRLSPGDRISGVTVSFEHIVLEDALTILSYASPYDVVVEVRSGRPIGGGQSQKGGRPVHPVFRSSSFAEASRVEKSAKKKLFPDDHASSLSSNYSSLQKSRSNMTTLERKESNSPRPNQPRSKKSHLNPEQLKAQLEQKILAESPKKVDSESQKSENKYQKFGVKVFPVEEQQKSPKIAEQNDNNINIEKNQVGIDEPDKIDRPLAKKREKKHENFERDGSLIKRDENGIPQEIPNYMLNAAVAARNNRKNLEDEESKTTKKLKGKAPSPPRDDEPSEKATEYNSDSDVEVDNQSSVNTIELNSSDVTVHQSEVEERQNRKTASTGDLSKIKNPRKTSSGTLERAQSLDITDAGMPGLKRSKEELELDDLLDNSILNKEPRLSLVLDGLNTFQRNKLKKSTEWGNLEDAILSKEDQIEDKEKEFEALVNKANEIKRESQEVEIPQEIIEKYTSEKKEKTEKPIKNQIWPVEASDEISTSKITKPARKHDLENKKNDVKLPKANLESDLEKYFVPAVQLRTKQNLKTINSDNTERKANKSDLEIPVAQLRTKNNLENLSTTPETRYYEVELTKPEENLEILDDSEKHTRNDMKYHEIDPRRPDVGAEARKLKNDLEMLKAQLGNTEIGKNNLEISEMPTIQLGNTETDRNNLEITESVPPGVQLRKTNHNLEIKDEHYSRRQQISPEPTSLPPENLENEVQVVTSQLEKRQRVPREIEQNVLPNFDKGIKDDIIKDEWEISIMNTSPPVSLSVVDENVSVFNTNTPDDRKEKNDVADLTQNFLYTEQMNYDDDYIKNVYGINACDDIKVSRHTFDKKTDDGRSKHVSNINVSTGNGDSNLHSLELSINEPSELYTTAFEETINSKEIVPDSKVTISTPDIIKNVTLTEAIAASNKEHEEEMARNEENSKSLTYITEIQVLTPNNESNISEIEIIPKREGNETNLESAFEDYVKNFEAKLDSFEKIEEMINDEPTSIILNDKTDAEKEVHKIHEIAEEQLKKLPEMRFTTSSYESHIKPPEKRHSFEQIRSNFERSPPKKENAKSRIPIATTAKTPPMSPERRDSRNLENENDRAILELMSSSVHSTPYASKIKPPSKNITVTSIRNSKIPSGLPTLGAGKPPLPPRKVDTGESNVQVSTNGNAESSFKQWVFNPANVTNVTVENSKDKVM